MSFANQLTEEMRLVMLRLLNELPSYRGNSSTLHGGLDRYGLTFSRDQVKSEIRWLADQGLILIEDDLDSVIVVKLSERGQDVATGRATAHGVKRPSA